MTRDESLEAAIGAVTALMRVCAEYEDLHTAQMAMRCQKALIGQRTPQQVAQMEAARGLAA